ncbi:MAG: endonuclease/exonuclease/phosphatase family protein [Burkholderiales bacterium]|nr:endonuclease/exonuclease/phosphatase family protein [Burkholderiales bacterium]
MLAIGDLNADSNVRRYPGGRYLAALREAGWGPPRPDGSWSYVSGTRMDHVLTSPSLSVPGARYVVEIDGRQLVSTDRLSRVSDHAAHVVECDESDNSAA